MSNREELKHAVLDVLQPVVILVENPIGLREIQVIFTASVPWELGDRLEEGADHLCLHRVLRRSLQPPEFAVHLLPRLGG